MAFPNQIPRIAEIVGPGIDDLRETRPDAAAQVDARGRYNDIFVGWKAQARLAIGVLSDEVASARLGLAVDEALTEVARSEFNTDRLGDPVAAVGNVYLRRPLVISPPTPLPGGAIPEGFRFRRNGVPQGIPAIPAMTYVTTREVPISANVLVAPRVPIVAVKPGADGNAPAYSSGGYNGAPIGSLVAIDTLFDPNFNIYAYDTGGGLDHETDDDLVRQAEAYATGQYGPNIAAIAAGALRGTGAHRAVVREITSFDDNGTRCAFTGVCVADASWGYGNQWLLNVAQVLQGIGGKDGFQGFGCAFLITGPVNVAVRVDCNVTLRDANALSNTEQITKNIQKGVRAYFDDRPDWYTWRLSGLRGAIIRSDRRILTCTNAQVIGVLANTTLSEPKAKPQAISSFVGIDVTQQSGLALIHYDLVSNGINATYFAPT